MNVWIIISVAAVLIALIVLDSAWTSHRWKRDQKRRRQAIALNQAPMLEWMQETAGLKGKALARARKYPYVDNARDIPGALEAEYRYDDAIAELDRAKRAQQTSKKLRQAAQLTDASEQHEALMAIRHDWLDETQQRQHYAELLSAATTHIFEQLLDRARSGDTLAFIDAKALLVKHGYRIYGQWILTAPQDWNDLVARLFENPHLNDFRVVKEPEPNQLLLMSAKALRTRSLTLAKIVLAFCAIKRARYDELGPVTIADLAKLVDELHAELGLFQNNQETNILSDS